MVMSSQPHGADFDFTKHFPKFRWLLRDVILPPVDENGDLLPLTEYIKNQVLLISDRSTPTKTQEVVNALLRLFPSFECHMLPTPSTKRDILKTITESESKLSMEFNGDVNELRLNLLNTIEPKTGDSQQYMNGSLLSTFVEACLASLNTPNIIPEMSYSWQAAMDHKVEMLLNHLVDNYQNELGQELDCRGAIEESIPANFATLEESLSPIPERDGEIQVIEMNVPISPEPARSVSSRRSTLRRASSPSTSSVSSIMTPVQVTAPRTLIGIHQSILDDKIKKFRGEIARSMGTALEKKKSELVSRLERRIVQYDKTAEGNCSSHVVGGVLLKYIQANHEKSKERCVQTFVDIVEPLKNNLTREVDCIRERYYTMAVGPAKDEVFAIKMREFEELADRLPPGSPRNLRVVGLAQDKIKIKWKRPNLHPRATKGYEVQIMPQVKQERRSEWKTLIDFTQKRATIVTNLTASTNYLFRVRGKNTNQIGEWSGEIEATTLMGQAGRYGASAAGFLGGSITAPVMLTVESFKEGVQIYKQSESCGEKVHAGAGIVVGGLMLPFIVLSESLLTTSTGVAVAESVYENTGTSSDDDFDENGTEIVSILPSPSEISISSSSSTSNTSESQSQSAAVQQVNNLDKENSRTFECQTPYTEDETKQPNETETHEQRLHSILRGDEQCARNQLNVDVEHVHDAGLTTDLSKEGGPDACLKSQGLLHQASTVSSSSCEGSIKNPSVTKYDSPSSPDNSISLTGCGVLHSFAFTDQQQN